VKKLGVVLLGGMVLAAGGQSEGTPGEAQTRVVVADPAGDVESQGEDPAKDVVEVALASDGKALGVEVTLAREAREYLEGHMAGDVVVLQIDADGDETTGGKLLFGRKPGFDLAIDVQACIQYKQGVACAGGFGDAPSTGFFSIYDVGRYEQDKPFPKSLREGSFTEATRWPIEGRKIHVEVPYTDLGVEPGQVLRIAIREADAGSFEAAYMPDVWLKLE
jgi:hypothetical protein